MIWRFISWLAGKVANGITKSLDEVLTVTPIVLWRKAVVFSILLILGGLWFVCNKVNSETVDKETWTKSCEASDKKVEKLADQVTIAIDELKTEIIGYRQDLLQERNDRIRDLESELRRKDRKQPANPSRAEHSGPD
jgi:hypothetical protein